MAVSSSTPKLTLCFKAFNLLAHIPFLIILGFASLGIPSSFNFSGVLSKSDRTCLCPSLLRYSY